jgi:threonine/homoserine/homoserine lactone efflux protein
MPALSTVAIFLFAALVLLVIPCPAVIYIVTRSMAQGKRAGLASVLGVELASLTHVAAATLGLSALLMTSALAFSVVKYLGAVSIPPEATRQGRFSCSAPCS